MQSSMGDYSRESIITAMKNPDSEAELAVRRLSDSAKTVCQNVWVS